jgi:type VI secretion system protein ImpB
MGLRMANSFQEEIPKARVNITLDVDTNGAQVKKELPMKLLALGDFSYGQAQGALSDRQRVNLNKNNFNEVLSSLSPKVSINVQNKINPTESDLKCDLTFKSLKDFSPERVVEQVPALNKLLAMRHLLKDLKASVLDNQSFRKKLEAILKDENETKSLGNELKQIMASSHREQL